MAETFDTYILWSGRGDDIYNKPVSLMPIDREDAIEHFDEIVSSGLAVKNDGFFLAPVSPAMTEEEIDKYDEDKELLCGIIKGEDEKFTLGGKIKEYASKNSDWLPEALTVEYDNDETDYEVTMTER